jgi:putative transposase
LITRLKADFAVTFLCDRLGVSRSRYYESLAPEPDVREARRGVLSAGVITAFAESKHAAGYRKVTMALRRKGIHANRKTVSKIMTELGLISPHAVRQFKTAKRRANRGKDPADLLTRNFDSLEMGRLLVGDITYVPTKEGWLYVATVIDLASRAVLGHATGSRQTSTLIIQALRNARATGLVPVGAVFHSDHGVQYRSKKFITECGTGIVRSMGAKFECWDNACAETFFSKLKTERLDWITFTTRHAATAEVNAYITHFNTQRLHQSLDYITPAEKIEQLTSAA